MLLTEPEAGSDVGALSTSAVKNGDGTYSITGNKIFISSGEHDLAENIIHGSDSVESAERELAIYFPDGLL
jgi:alkylation response protein AidB-like acyl-CoA dehydrogenase